MGLFEENAKAVREIDALTAHDRRLLQMAQRSRSCDFCIQLEELAESERAKEMIHEEAIRCHHYEEWEAGCL